MRGVSQAGLALVEPAESSIAARNPGVRDAATLVDHLSAAGTGGVRAPSAAPISLRCASSRRRWGGLGCFAPISELTVGISFALRDPRGYVDLQVWPAAGKKFPSPTGVRCSDTVVRGGPAGRGGGEDRRGASQGAGGIGWSTPLQQAAQPAGRWTAEWGRCCGVLLGDPRVVGGGAKSPPSRCLLQVQRRVVVRATRVALASRTLPSCRCTS